MFKGFGVCIPCSSSVSSIAVLYLYLLCMFYMETGLIDCADVTSVIKIYALSGSRWERTVCGGILEI